jgi:predicted transposase YbfD/YdcC
MQPCEEQNSSFYERLQTTEGLDLRDNRGKRHDLGVVLMGVTLALLSNRDGCLSSIHRHLVNHYEELTKYLGVEAKRPISRAQLPRLLEQVAEPFFADLFLTQYGRELKKTEKEWFALDGKELRGSLAPQAKRGTAVVRAIAHRDQHCANQTYYDGVKESEIVAVRALLTPALASQKLSADALHCQVTTLEQIVKARGKDVVSVKENQPEWLKLVQEVSAQTPSFCQLQSVEKGHGRLESRSYEFYDLLETEPAPRWAESQIRTGVKVQREREELKTGKCSVEESYYITNEVGNYEEISTAIRRHWQVETNNHVRDVSLQEDQLRSQKRGVQRILAGTRTLVLEILRKLGCTNKKAQLEAFADHFHDLLFSMRSQNLL